VNTIRDAWLDFESKVIPADASPLQRIEMRRAFYAGATTVVMINTGPIADASDGRRRRNDSRSIEECLAFASK
jgi:hypothetical protein